MTAIPNPPSDFLARTQRGLVPLTCTLDQNRRSEDAHRKRNGHWSCFEGASSFHRTGTFYQIKSKAVSALFYWLADMPAPSVGLVRLALGGLVPWQIVWEYNPIRAGGYSDYIHKLNAMFSSDDRASDDTAHHIRDVLLSCRSIEDARALLLQRERLANSSNNDIADDFTRSKPRSVTSNDGWTLGMSSPHRAPLPEGINPAIRQDDGKRGNGEAERFFEKDVDRTKPSTVPNRYHIRQEGKTRILTCVEAPTVTVRAERGLAISATEARKYRAGTIFLDGAAQGEPFIDVQKELYNLDHHEGCIRSLATCEQAMVLIRKGLDLSKRDWVVLANDADLDTVFALWALLNHNRLSDRSNVRAKIMPLLCLQGCRCPWSRRARPGRAAAGSARSRMRC